MWRVATMPASTGSRRSRCSRLPDVHGRHPYKELLRLERRARHGIASCAAHVAHRSVAHEPLVESSDTVAPLGVALSADDDFGALRESRGDALHEPKRTRSIAIAGNEHRRHG